MICPNCGSDNTEFVCETEDNEFYFCESCGCDFDLDEAVEDSETIWDEFI